MTAYEQGFIDKCASAGVEPGVLVKAAARGDRIVKLLRGSHGLSGMFSSRGALLSRMQDATHFQLAPAKERMQSSSRLIDVPPFNDMTGAGGRASLKGIRSRPGSDTLPQIAERLKQLIAEIKPPRSSKPISAIVESPFAQTFRGL